MGSHSNKTIKKHVDNSKILNEKMQELVEVLHSNLETQFEKDLGVKIPNALQAEIREIDIAMVYSTDASVDEYMDGANSILGAVFSGDEADIVTKSLDFVGEVVRKVIGSSTIEVGIHSSSGKIKSSEGETYAVACYTSTEMCSSKEWLTDSDFFVSNYCLIVWKLDQ